MTDSHQNRSSITLLASLLGLNLLVWIATLATPRLLTAAFLAWTFGLRHALDADHIAAIDSVTRKLMAQEKKLLGVGLFFSLGHSSVVCFATLALLLLPSHNWMESWHEMGGLIGSVVSILFLVIMTVSNGAAAYRQWRAQLSGTLSEKQVAQGPSGLLTRMVAPVTKRIQHDWQMFPLGFLFGLGFDTATEIGLLGLTTAQASQGLSMLSIMLLPALFTAGMAFMDSLDTVLMVRAWTWSGGSTLRRAHYGLAITTVSALASGLVALIEAGQFAADAAAMPHPLQTLLSVVMDHFEILGMMIALVFLGLWAIVAIRSARDSRTACTENS
ncbi:HoxN/HupN/NixA family nickel/cobalt transporter [Acetobacter sp.]|uniref:HoxN/HupN/NixA family nickel/cobalt transporter n=1 Tax=Acetobacter sp. TaxID=440 RepID=UPI0039E9B6FF